MATDTIPAPPQHRQLSAGEQKKLADHAFKIEKRIKTHQRGAEKEMWRLAKAVYEFHEAAGWGLLGHDTLEAWLADPEISIRRSQFFSLSRMYRDLAVVREVPMATLEQLPQSKVAYVVPAIMAGEAKLDDALSDVGVMGARDLRIKYRREAEPDPAKNGDGPTASNGGDPVKGDVEPAPKGDPVPKSNLKSDAERMAINLVYALQESKHVTLKASWQRLSPEEQIEVATKWLEEAAK